MFLPTRSEKARDTLSNDDHLPKGNCRYIILHPEVKGLRCACVVFSLNRSIPGSTCECGHQACYHTAEKETTVDRHEIEILKEKVQFLEDELSRERHGGHGGLLDRLGRLEEMVDRKNAESEVELKGVYRGLGGLWHNVGMLNTGARAHDDHIEALVDDVQRMRTRLIDIDDASMVVEERVDALEGRRSTLPERNERRASTPAVLGPALSNTTSATTEQAVEIDQPMRNIFTSDIYRSTREYSPHAWTVHISLMPSSSTPFPFEKDTVAYKRCLSRGLHRVVAIAGTDGDSFVDAVSDAFADILMGREWIPLLARLCDAKNLCGLPMLRKLPTHLIGREYNVTFLQDNCALLNDIGRIDHLYIAMTGAALSWSDLKHSPCFLRGLEACWDYDPLLDRPCSGCDTIVGGAGQPAAGDLVPNWSPSTARLKRTASGISRASSFGSTTEVEDARAKIRRQCAATNMEVIGRRAEAV